LPSYFASPFKGIENIRDSAHPVAILVAARWVFMQRPLQLDIGFKTINLDCVIGRRDITIQLPPSILAKLIILKPIEDSA
jgi:hypothetical protein